MNLDVGAIAPDFSLPNQDWQPIRLSAHVGREPVVLAFYPAAFSSVCTAELCRLKDGLVDLTLSGAAVYGISVDTPWVLKAFRADQNLPFHLLSDFNKDVIRLFGVYCEDMIGLKGIAKRAVFLIDRHGIIRHLEVLQDARNEPDYRALESSLARL